MKWKPWWKLTLDDIRRPCAFCRGKPTLQTKSVTHRYRHDSSERYRMICRNPNCIGHTGRWQGEVARAVLAWNHSQETKYHTIKRFLSRRME